MSFEVDMDVGGSNLASGNQFATPQDPEVVAAAQPPSIDSIIKSFDKTEARTPRKTEEKSSPMTPSSEKKKGFNRLIDKIFMSPKSTKTGSSKLGTPIKSPAPAPSPARDAQGFAVPSPQVRSTPNMIVRQASIRHMNTQHSMSGIALNRQASIRGSFVPSSPRAPIPNRLVASPAIPNVLPRQASNASIRLKKQSAWRNTTAITNAQLFAQAPAAAAATSAAAVPDDSRGAVDCGPAPLVVELAPPAALVSPRNNDEKEKEKEQEKEVSNKQTDDVAKETTHKPHKSKEEKERRRALKKKKVSEKKAADTAAEAPERQTERKASPTASKENGSTVSRSKGVLSPSQSMSTLSPSANNSPSRRAFASHNNGSELPWLV